MRNATMRKLNKVVLIAVILGAVAFTATPQAAERWTPTRAFEGVVSRAEQYSGSRIGFAARHLETGAAISVNGGEFFPMASTVKIAVAGLLMTKIDQGQLTLRQMIDVEDIFLERTGDIAQSIPHPGVMLSVENLLELMLTRSNNTATDVLMDLVGGPEAVTAWLRSVGVEDQTVDYDINGLLNRFYDLPTEEPFSVGIDVLRARNENLRTQYTPNARFEADAKDVSTPLAMNQLLTKIFTYEILSRESTDVLKAVMERCATGAMRIKGLLPDGTVVAHKTGTMAGLANDVGVITLPDDRGHVVVSIFLRGSAEPSEVMERALAEVARAAYDYYLFR